MQGSLGEREVIEGLQHGGISGRTGIDWGVYGVPETFIVDKDGRIAYKHIGPLTEASITDIILPEIDKAERGTAAASLVLPND